MKSLGIFLVILVVVSSAQASRKRHHSREPKVIHAPAPLDNDRTNDVGKPVVTKNGKYLATWESLDSRPLPNWYDESKVGIFIHWGVFSVPGFGSEWFWKTWKTGSQRYVDYMEKNYKPGFTYQEFAPMFTAEFFNASSWASLFQKSGAKYIVLTSKHHEGYTLWPSKYAFSWNAKAVGPKRDLVGELANAIRANTTLRFGLYHSLYEWFNPLWESDSANNHTTDEFVRYKTLPELYEIVNNYKPEVVWSDGEWEAPDTYWKSKEFLAWLYNDSPVNQTVVTNDRWGHETLCKHGGYYTCADRYNPGVLLPHKWENCMTLDQESWGFRRDAVLEDYLTPEQLIGTLVSTVSCGGNLLVNVGPTRDGMIVPIQQERLLQLGEWLDVNGNAIYESKPWIFQNDTVTPDVWYTSNPSRREVYAITLKWPGNELHLASVSPEMVSSIDILGGETSILWAANGTGINILLPGLDGIKSRWAWTIVIHEK